MSETKSRRIGIAIPCQDQVDSWFAHDLARAMTHHAYAFPNDSIAMSMHQSAFLAESRNELVKGLLENEDVDYVIFLDSDMRFPATLLNDLVSHDLPVVAANCAKRRRPISATARKLDAEGNVSAVWPDPEKQEGIERVQIVGSAVMCIRKDVFFQIEYPWFHTPWHSQDQRFVGEDLYFCAQLKKFDVPLYIDHGVSWQVRHIGQYEYGMNDVLGERELARRGHWNHLASEIKTEPLVLVKP